MFFVNRMKIKINDQLILYNKHQHLQKNAQQLLRIVKMQLDPSLRQIRIDRMRKNGSNVHAYKRRLKVTQLEKVRLIKVNELKLT